MVEFGNIEKGELFGRAQYNGHTLHRFQAPLVMCLFLWKSTNWKMLPFAPKNLKSNGSNCLNFFPNWWSNFTNTILLYKLAIVLFLFKKSTYFHSHPLGGKIACWLATVWASGASLCIQHWADLLSMSGYAVYIILQYFHQTPLVYQFCFIVYDALEFIL